ncbi:MAG TPA: DUF4332 domain-containing protein [Niabella sp.]|jgi:predicted flap endonuclease-1-like 5' DNA nuclease|nr:DUF4332 domain-containing protein [Niabella sp.]
MKKITFNLPAEALGEATEALLLGDFNNWSLEEAIKLSVQKDGSLKASVLLEEGKSYQFRYLLNDGRWINDWNADDYVHNTVFGVQNSVIFVPVDEVVATQEVVEAKVEKPAKKAKTVKATKETKTVKETKTAKAPAKPKKAVKAEAPAADDLTKIEGIGPKISQLLKAEGIQSFKELSKATTKNLKAILEAAGSKFQVHDPSTWAKQAKLAAAEKWEKLLDLQAELKGGKATKK